MSYITDKIRSHLLIFASSIEPTGPCSDQTQSQFLAEGEVAISVEILMGKIFHGKFIGIDYTFQILSERFLFMCCPQYLIFSALYYGYFHS